MFKERLKEASAWVLAAIIVIASIVVPVGLIELTWFINKSLPEIIFSIIVIGFWVIWLGYQLWRWIKWQFVEPYKAAKAEKEAKGE